MDKVVKFVIAINLSGLHNEIYQVTNGWDCDDSLWDSTEEFDFDLTGARIKNGLLLHGDPGGCLKIAFDTKDEAQAYHTALKLYRDHIKLVV